jgi:hypothetical protein
MVVAIHITNRFAAAIPTNIICIVTPNPIVRTAIIISDIAYTVVIANTITVIVTVAIANRIGIR